MGRAGNRRRPSRVRRLLQRYYRSELDRLDLAARFAPRTHYEDLRLAILNTIVDTTPNGYRRSDARFLIGTIYWRAGKPADAIRAWSIDLLLNN